MIDDVQIIIDPGHGGAEIGAVTAGYKEKDVNLKISLSLYKKVKAYFSNVTMIRTDDVYFGINERASWAAQKAEEFPGRTICLSIHLNAFDGSARGVEVIYSIHSDSKLADSIAGKVAELGIPFRRTYSKESETYPGFDYYCMHRGSGKAQTVIVESLFLDNADDAAFLTEPDFIDNLAQKIAEGLIEYQKPCMEKHWAKKDNDDLMARGILKKDHTESLDKPASEGFVIALVNRIMKTQ